METSNRRLKYFTELVGYDEQIMANKATIKIKGQLHMPSQDESLLNSCLTKLR